MLIVGLTGGLASGKTTVAKRFAAHGVPVLDADEIARELVEPGQPALRQIAELFGPSIVDPAGRMDRRRLHSIVFAHPDRRKALEDILHPLVRAAMEERLGTLSVPYCILAIPLLLESGMTDLVDRILVVDAPEQLQYARASTRDKLSDQDIQAVLEAQTSRAERLAAADDIILNDGDLEHLYRQVDALHNYYLSLARRPRE
jgi:dephospho-CoA kinase